VDLAARSSRLQEHVGNPPAERADIILGKGGPGQLLANEVADVRHRRRTRPECARDHDDREDVDAICGRSVDRMHRIPSSADVRGARCPP
jgi:hypothetical protein